ncbi:MAG: hypothetical protein FGM52_06360 [Mycobacterium sp.]|nr:hypothetical protein [Mycobacterium sp.]
MRSIILGGGLAAATTAILAVGWGAGPGSAAPGDTNTTLNVVGEPYAKAVIILRAQGVRSVFGGSVGSDVPQSQCVVASQRVLGTTRTMQLNLDCSAEAQPQRPAATSQATSGAASSGAQATETAARPTPGAPGVVSVTAVPVG